MTIFSQYGMKIKYLMEANKYLKKTNNLFTSSLENINRESATSFRTKDHKIF